MKIIIITLIYSLLPVTAIRMLQRLVIPPLHVKHDNKKVNQIVWDSTSLSRISLPGVPAFYPRMLQLHNGSLVVAYASQGNIVTQKSVDGGKQWEQPVIAAGTGERINMDTPELLQLANGALLLCYNGRPQGALRKVPEPGKRFDIRIKLSNDNGTYWQAEKIIYQAGESFKDGCWEPSALQLPSGEIELFFSDEAVYTQSNEQNISLLRSTDAGACWSAKPQIISFKKNSRDGMPVPIWLSSEKEIAVSIEDPGDGNFKPAIIHSGTNGQWPAQVTGSDSKRAYALLDRLPAVVYAGAPYLRRLSSGTTVLAYQSTENRHGANTDANAVMVVATGNAHAGEFSNKTTPFTIPEHFHALWNALCITKNDTIIAVTSTNGYSRAGSEIWMIKGMIP